MILQDPTVAICSGEKYAPGVWEGRRILDEIDLYMDAYGPIQPGVDYADDSDWAEFFRENVVMYAPGVYAIRYLDPEYCRKLLVELHKAEYTTNPEEPEEAQIPEVVLEEANYGLFQCMKGLFDGYVKKLAYILMGLETGHAVSIQAARYTPDNTPHGCWHTDRDSEVTLVVSLSDTHTGGGTTVYQGPLMAPVTVPQLATGWAMLFAGRTNEHMGLPVTAGTRNLLVHWYKLEN
ncbi:2OG-Fe(II) oxygenase [Pseudomonas phage vB_PpuP-Vasula]